MEDSVSGERKG